MNVPKTKGDCHFIPVPIHIPHTTNVISTQYNFRSAKSLASSALNLAWLFCLTRKSQRVAVLPLRPAELDSEISPLADAADVLLIDAADVLLIDAADVLLTLVRLGEEVCAFAPPVLLACV